MLLFGGEFMEKTDLKYFLASNSCEGFVSFFEKSYNPYDNWKAYIIKGGPGTGKSSFMKKVATYAQNNKQNFILCPCSSDPDSLDGVILPNKKIIILDGTTPHTIDPIYPAVCEEILNFGQFWDSDKITDQTQIIEITNRNKALHKTASCYLQAVGKFVLDNYKTALACTSKTKVKKLANTIAKRYIPKSNTAAYEWVRFISGITPKGLISYPESITKTCENIIVISDEYYASSNILINEIRNFALKNGHEIITLLNPFLPPLITDHIIIPSLSLAFVTENSKLKFDINARRIHARRFTSNKFLHNSTQRIKFNKKAINNILNTACNTLNEAKQVHDQLESHYINAMNFTELNEFADKFCKKIF